MEYSVERRISLMHALAGAIFGLASPFLFTRTLTFVSVIILGLFIAYPLYLLSCRVFSLPQKEFSLKDWLGKGYLYFLAAWILVWTILYNFQIA